MRHHPKLNAVLISVLATGLAAGTLSACSSSSKSSDTTSAAAAKCVVPATWKAVQAKVAADQPVAGRTSDYNLTSFDGTEIRVHWFPNAKASAANPMPTVFMGPGWGSGGDTNTKATGILGATSISSLWQAGFNVVTWDPRGFGVSGGTIQVDSPQFEAKDASAIISWVAQRPGVQVEAPGNPRMGMVGGSYGGGIQFVTAARDCRVDAIAPTIAWHSLVTSLFKHHDPKSGWAGILTNASSGRKVNDHVSSSQASQTATGMVARRDVAFFASRGPGALVRQVHVPTLILQGTVDGLFTLQEGIENYNALHAAGTTVAMAWFCGGHGICLTPPGSINAGTLSINWMKRYVANDTSVKAATGLTFVDQNGTAYQAAGWPLASAGTLTAQGNGTLALEAGGGSVPPSTSGQASSAKSVVDSVALAVTPGPAAKAVDVPVTFAKNGLIAGVPKLRLAYSGPHQAGATKPTRVYAQIVDPATGLVLGNQVTPITLKLDGKTHRVALPLEAVVFAGKPGAKLTLQITATSDAYAPGQLGGSVTFSAVGLRLPLVAGAKVVARG